MLRATKTDRKPTRKELRMLVESERLVLPLLASHIVSQRVVVEVGHLLFSALWAIDANVVLVKLLVLVVVAVPEVLLDDPAILRVGHLAAVNQRLGVSKVSAKVGDIVELPVLGVLVDYLSPSGDGLALDRDGIGEGCASNDGHSGDEEGGELHLEKKER